MAAGGRTRTDMGLAVTRPSKSDHHRNGDVMDIRIDLDRCCGNGMCCGLAPDYFELDADGKVQLLRPTAGAEDLDVLEQAVLCCPVEAISLT
jgi:ferredoxin